MTAAQAAELYIDKGLHPIPLPPRAKKPIMTGWPLLRLTKADLANHFNGSLMNVGVILGDEHGTADVDLDCFEAVRVGAELLPETGMVFGRASKPASHFLYQSNPPVRTKQYKDPITKTCMIVELRCQKSDGSIGLQTVVPPSVHPEGEEIRFEGGRDRQPANIAAPVLQAAVAKVAAAALLARHWPGEKGGRNLCFLALAGALARLGWTLDQTIGVHRALYRALWGEQADFYACSAEVQATYDKHASGFRTTGKPTIEELMDKGVVRTALSWLGISEPKAELGKLVGSHDIVGEPDFERPPFSSGWPRIQVNDRQLRDTTGDSLGALRTLNTPPSIFVRGGRPACVNKQENGRHVIIEANDKVIRHRLARAADFYRCTKKGTFNCPPPMDVVTDLLAMPPLEWGFPALQGIIEAPALREDGTIIMAPGYDAQTGLYYAQPDGLKMPEIPVHPTSDHIDVALDMVRDIITDFPFVDVASRANAIASMLTPVVRPAIKGPTPLALYDATTQGTGKTLLSEVVSLIISGREAALFSAPRELEEWRKQLTSVLREGSAIVVIDNVNYRLDSGDLCKALTETTHGDRILGQSQTINLPVRCAWIATGNNMQLGGDMPRRCYWIRMDAQCAKPFQRTQFKHKRLKEYVLKHRGELLAALLTLPRAWFVAGCPEPHIRPLGSFEDWSRIIGGILEYAGVEGFLANSDQLYEQADIESVQWETFLRTLDAAFHGEPFTVSQVWNRMSERTWNEATMQTQLSEAAEGLRAALPDFITQAMDREGFCKQRLGMAFSQRAGRRYGESQIRIERDVQDRHSKVRRWKVVPQ